MLFQQDTNKKTGGPDTKFLDFGNEVDIIKRNFGVELRSEIQDNVCTYIYISNIELNANWTEWNINGERTYNSTTTGMAMTTKGETTGSSKWTKVKFTAAINGSRGRRGYRRLKKKSGQRLYDGEMPLWACVERETMLEVK